MADEIQSSGQTSTALTSALQPGDERAYDAIADVIRSKAALLLIPFPEAGSRRAIRNALNQEQFSKKFCTAADRFCQECSLEAAKIIRQGTVVPEVRARPTGNLSRDIRKQVFGSLVKDTKGVNKLLDQMEELRILQLSGRIDDSERRRQLASLLNTSGTIIKRSVAEYFDDLVAISENYLDFCYAKTFADQVSFDRQQAVVNQVRSDLHRAFEPIICAIGSDTGDDRQQPDAAAENTDEVEPDDWQNDPFSPRLWFAFIKGFALVMLILFVIGGVVVVLLL